MFSTPEEMILAVEDYFEWIKGEFKDEPVKQEDGTTVMTRIWVRYPEPPTITGLALHLGFESRQSIYDYEKNGEFSYLIKNARLRVEKGYELGLHGDKPVGSIFALKNMGWSDKTQQEISGPNGGPVQFNIIMPPGE